jgi:hypothetical protein
MTSGDSVGSLPVFSVLACFNPQWPNLIWECPNSPVNQVLTAAAHDRFVMLKGATIAALALTIASQIDQYLSNGRYTDVAFAMLRQIRHSFGV